MDILPANLVICVPGEGHFDAIVELQNACDLVDCGQPDSPPDQLQGEWQSPDFHLDTDARIVLTPDGRIVAYAAIDGVHDSGRNRFSVCVHPDYRGKGLGSCLLTFIEERERDLVLLTAPDVRVSLQTWVNSDNRPARELLEARGFLCSRSTWAMMITLQEEPPQPVWPAHVALRPFVPERDARAVFEAQDESFQDHWGHVPGNFARWYQQRMVNDTRLDPSLWHVACDGDEVAGLAICGYYFESGIVYVLGVRRPWRRLGLGLALLRHAFGDFYRRDTRKVTLGVDAQSLTGATRLYERAGMSVELSYATYQKEMRSGIDLSTQVLDTL